jgi:NAD(P)H-hydrate epimerase
VEEVRAIVARLSKPLVLDADGINAFDGHLDLLARPEYPRVLTPHPGELSRLIGKPIAEIQKNRESIAKRIASLLGVTLVLKGHRTVVSDGKQTYVNTTGNPGMATGGTGDVLTGVIAALIGQGLSPFDAARLGAYLHGLAGDIAAKSVGMVSLMATDLLAALPDAIRRQAT